MYKFVTLLCFSITYIFRCHGYYHISSRRASLLFSFLPSFACNPFACLPIATLLYYLLSLFFLYPSWSFRCVEDADEVSTLVPTFDTFSVVSGLLRYTTESSASYRRNTFANESRSSPPLHLLEELAKHFLLRSFFSRAPRKRDLQFSPNNP